MKKALSIVAVLALVSILAVALVACLPAQDETIKNLKEAGYTIREYNGYGSDYNALLQEYKTEMAERAKNDLSADIIEDIDNDNRYDDYEVSSVVVAEKPESLLYIFYFDYTEDAQGYFNHNLKDLETSKYWRAGTIENVVYVGSDFAITAMGEIDEAEAKRDKK